MSDQDSRGQHTPLRPAQFTLRRLLVLTAACALLLGMVTWIGFEGLLLYHLGLGLYLVAHGLYRGKLWLATCGCYVLLAWACALFYWVVFLLL